jgi:hypothetical protein
MSVSCQKAAAAFGIVLAVVAQALIAYADGIEPGLWKITTKTQTRGETGPSQESSKCLTSEDTRDLATTFSPVSRTVNSTCAPIERTLTGTRLSWRITCKGQINMELTGEFNFDSPRHYSATLHSKAEMVGVPMIDSETTLEGKWVSACPQ